MMLLCSLGVLTWPFWECAMFLTNPPTDSAVRAMVYLRKGRPATSDAWLGGVCARTALTYSYVESSLGGIVLIYSKCGNFVAYAGALFLIAMA